MVTMLTKNWTLKCCLLVVLISVFILAALFAGCFQGWDDTYHNKVSFAVEQYENNYVITLTSAQYTTSFQYIHYSLKDTNGTLLSGNLGDVYELDPRFLEEDLSPQPLRVIFHENHLDGAISVNDTFVLCSSDNGGPVKANMTFTLRHMSQDDDEYFLKVRLPGTI